jgi:hypothetical protein
MVSAMYGKAALATRVGSSGTSPRDGGRHNIVGRLSKRTRVQRWEEARFGAKVSALAKGTLKAFATSINVGEVWAALPTSIKGVVAMFREERTFCKLNRAIRRMA